MNYSFCSKILFFSVTPTPSEDAPWSANRKKAKTKVLLSGYGGRTWSDAINSVSTFSRRTRTLRRVGEHVLRNVCAQVSTRVIRTSSNINTIPKKRVTKERVIVCMRGSTWEFLLSCARWLQYPFSWTECECAVRHGNYVTTRFLIEQIATQKANTFTHTECRFRVHFHSLGFPLTP